MPRAEVRFYRATNDKVPFYDWLDRLPEKVRAKCVVAIERLEELGHELRRPQADLLRDGIYELRLRLGRVHYRILYFFHGRGVAVVSHGTTKEDRVREADIDLALENKRRYAADPALHTAPMQQ